MSAGDGSLAAVCVETEITRLKAETTATKQRLRAARDEILKERNRLLLGLLDFDQRLLATKAEDLALAFKQGETVLGQAVHAAQQLAKRHAKKPRRVREVSLQRRRSRARTGRALKRDTCGE